MPRGYRSIIFAAFGWLILIGASQPPEGAKHTQESVATRELREAVNSVASAIKEAAKSGERDRGCDEEADKRDSDLCAQWIAADATRDAAEYSLWALFVSSVGTVLLVWTLWETRANARRELRAYVSVQATATGIHVISGKEVRFTQDAVAHNGGSTPAYNFVSFGNIIAAPNDVAAKYLAKPLPIEKNALNGGFVVHSGQDSPVTFDREIVIPMSEIDGILNGHLCLYLYGTISYIDTFHVRRRTDYCYVLESEKFRETWVEAMANRTEKIGVIWKTARFHNSAT